jgi:hypothetical protein
MSLEHFWMGRAIASHELEHAIREAGDGVLDPQWAVLSWVHERLNLTGYKTVIDKKIFLDFELLILLLEVARPVILDPLPEDQILRPRWGANRIGLNETKSGQATRQTRNLPQGPVNTERPKFLERDAG